MHGRDEFLPYKLKIKAIQRRSCGPGMPGPYSSTQKSAPRISAWGTFYVALAVKQPLHKLLVQVDQLGQVLVTGIGGSLVLLEQSLGAIREGASQTAVTSLVG